MIRENCQFQCFKIILLHLDFGDNLKYNSQGRFQIIYFLAWLLL